MRESAIEKRLREEVKNIGGICLKFVPIHYIGFPDRICLVPFGIMKLVELKKKNAKPRKIQLVVHRKLVKLGFEVIIIDSIEKVKEFIENVKREQSTHISKGVGKTHTKT